MVVLLATGGYDHSIRFWDASSGVCYKSLSHPERQVNCLAVSPDKSYLLAGGGGGSLRLYDVHAKGSDPLATYEGHTGNVTGVGFQRDGRWMYSCSEDGGVRIWDPRTSTSQRDYECRAGVSSVALHPNQGELITGDLGGTVRTWDLIANRCSMELSPEGDTPVSAVAIASDASILVAGNHNGSLFAWAPQGAGAEYTPLRRLAAHRAYILSVRLSPDTRYLATCSSDRTAKLWTTADWSLSTPLAGHSRWVWDCAWSADSSYLVTASSDQTARLWEVATGEVVRTYTGHHKAVTAVTLNDGVVPGAGAGAGAGGGAATAGAAAAQAPATAVAPAAPSTATAAAAPGAGLT
jgi:G protein beta subunit-like protein